MNRKTKRLVLAVCLLIFVCSLAAIFAACDFDEGFRVVYYTIYDPDDNSNNQSHTVYVKDNLFSFDFGQTPWMEHATFLGLYDAYEGGIQVIDAHGNPVITIDRDMTLYAHWSYDICHIVFDPVEGYLPDNQLTMNVEYNSKIYVMPVPERDGYGFVGWFDVFGGQVSEGSLVVSHRQRFNSNSYYFENDVVTLVARFAIRKYELTFDFNDGTNTTETVEVNHGNTLENVNLPTRDTGSKEIIGWSIYPNSLVPFEGTFTGDVTLYAIWAEYKVFKLHTWDTNYIDAKVYKGETFELPTPERAGYDFDGWYENSYFSGNPIYSLYYSFSGEGVYARWSMVTYTLSFETNGGDAVLEDVKYTIEDGFKLPEAGNREHYTFVGWCIEEDLSDVPFTYLPLGTHDVTKLYAKWRGMDVTVNLDPNGGTIPSTKRTVEYGAKARLGVPLKEGYEFRGWFDENGVQVAGKDGVTFEDWLIVENGTMLYAEYLKKYYVTVTYSHANAGKVTVSSYYVVGDEVALSVEIADQGYLFEGIYRNGELVSSVTTYTFVMPEADVQIHIAFEARSFTVTLNSDGGYINTQKVEVRYHEEFTLPPSFKEGYLFNGWEYEGELITDASGKGLKPWSLLSDIEVTASFAVDSDAANKILVRNAAELQSIADDPSKTYILTTDIDLASVTWTPFAFSGTLVGNGFTIKNFHVSSESGNLGMFTTVSGTISDLNFEGLRVTSTDYNNVFVGGVCGELTGTLNRVNVVSGTVSGKTSYVGGIVGKMSNGTMSGCVNGATVKGEGNDTEGGTSGGVVGWYAGGSISDCENKGAVSNNRYAGGVMGYATAIGFSTLTNRGTVDGGNYTGGVIGSLVYGGNITIGSVLSNYGAVKGADYVGGIVGYFYDKTASSNYNLTVNRLFNGGTVQGNNYVGGIFGYIYAEDNKSYSSYVITLTARDLTNEGNVTGEGYVGGLFGYGFSDTANSMLRDSSSNATITGKYYVGGLAGYLQNIQMASCSNAGTKLDVSGYVLTDNVYYAYAGGYVGRGYAVSNCSNAAEIVYTERGMYVGGIAGYVNGDLSNCTNTAKIEAKRASCVGGIVGYQDKRGNLSMTDLENSGSVTGVDDVGGIVGRVYDHTTDNNFTLTAARLTNRGVISGAENVGGIFGYLWADDTKSYSSYVITVTALTLVNEGDVTGTANVGGLVGFGYSDSTNSRISDSRSRAKVTAEYRVGGLGGYLQNIQIDNCSNAGTSVEATGYLVDNGNYYAYVGGYVGQGYSVAGANNVANITYNERGSYVGGIAGYSNGDVTNCSNTGRITATKASCVGGIVGYEDKRGNLTVSNNSNSGAVVGVNDVGGIIGRVYDHTTDANHTMTLSRLTNTGNVTGVDNVGGILGYVWADDTKSYESYVITITATDLGNSGNVTGAANVGGLIGYAYSDTRNSQIGESSSRGTVSGEYRVGGLAGYLQNVKIDHCSNSGTQIVATSYLVDNGSYYAYVGGYVGQGYAVSDCDNESDVIYQERGSYVGGIAGYLNGNVQNCSNTGTVNAAQSNGVGGIVGYSNGDANYTLSNLTNSGDVTGHDYVGGIVGRLYVRTTDANHVLTVNRVSNSGAITGNDYVAGIFGYYYTEDVKSYNSYTFIMTATNVTNSGNVVGESHVGSFVGYFYSDGASTLTGYTSTGTVNGAAADDTNLVGEKTNLTINA